REVVRFVRQRTRVIGALIQPVLFWILFGAGLRGSFQAPAWAPAGMTYQEYFFPGIAVLIVLFTAIFSTISIIEDRREGFLQGVLVAPVSRISIVAGKLLGGTALAMFQAGLFLLIGPLLSIVGLAPALELAWTPSSVACGVLFLCLISVQLTAIGFLIAWPMNSTQGFHAVMSVFLMPMWLLSGSFFPGGNSGWLSWIVRGNPLTYGVAGLRRMLYAETLPASAELPSTFVCLLVTLLTTAVCVYLSVMLVRRPHVRNVSS
ncbi:MAG: ABC transporter permease, partial [Planctomycetaceae bacterium]|nr:ABC transporter permease [Planctomycetaceae bacterium]